MRFTHLINPFCAKAGSEHDRAQRVTFASMRRAVEDAKQGGIDVEIVAAVFEEDISAIQPPARNLPSLTRSVLDVAPLSPPRKFPLVGDLLRLARKHGGGEYLIFSNVDIALQRHFYRAVDEMVRACSPHPLACCINRRTISNHYGGAEEIEKMYADEGAKHPGYDCFVFPMQFVDRMVVGHACIGARHFDSLLLANIDALSTFRGRIFSDLHLTFHLGDDRNWVSKIDYEEFNLRECLRASRHLCRKFRPPTESLFTYLHNRFESHAGTKQWVIRKLKRSDRLVRFARRIREGFDSPESGAPGSVQAVARSARSVGTETDPP